MIQISHIAKSFNNGKTYVVNNVSLTIAHGETLVLLGSSGSGKTTLLKMINRLIEPSKGKITINNKNITDYTLQALRFQLGYVFQQIGLFPHMNVEKNISIVLQLQNKSRTEQLIRAHELLELVNLDPKKFAKRYPHELSGGQQQRIGVARALAANPNCLLLDEPFGALDAITRDALQEEILRLNKKLNKTIIFVTHDILEAFRIADRIAVLHHGKLEQIGTKDELIKHPASPFVKELISKTLNQQEVIK